MENQIEKNILDIFLYKNKLKFNEIEKNIKIRSNKLAYHIKSLLNKNILQKENEEYILSETAEYLIPYLSNKQSLLPVILIHIGDKNEAFLYTRTKRPFLGKLSLPGGRILIGENLDKATKRIMKEKFNLEVKIDYVKSVSFEHVKRKNKIIHSFILITVKAQTKQKVKLTSLANNRNKIITSDYQLIKQDTRIPIKNITTKT